MSVVAGYCITLKPSCDRNGVPFVVEGLSVRNIVPQADSLVLQLIVTATAPAVPSAPLTLCGYPRLLQGDQVIVVFPEARQLRDDPTRWRLRAAVDVPWPLLHSNQLQLLHLEFHVQVGSSQVKSTLPFWRSSRSFHHAQRPTTGYELEVPTDRLTPTPYQAGEQAAQWLEWEGML